MGRVRRIVIALAGVMVGHDVVHAMPHDHPNDAAHGYVVVASALLIPAGIVALAGLVREGRRSGTTAVHPGRLAALQAALFAGQELLEATATGTPPTVATLDPVMWIGVCLQAAIGWTIYAALMAIRWVMFVGRRVAAGPLLRTGWVSTAPWRFHEWRTAGRLPVRGPPPSFSI